MLIVTWEGVILSKEMVSHDTFSVLKYDQSLVHQKVWFLVNNTILKLIIVNRDCKSLLENGHNTSKTYTISPDGQTPFEVS